MKQLKTNVTMTTLEIAKLTGKRHKNVLRDVKEKLIPVLGGLSFEPSSDVEETTYLSTQNKPLPMYTLQKRAVHALMCN